MFGFMEYYLESGFSLLPVLIGLFGLGTILEEAEKGVKDEVQSVNGASLAVGSGESKKFSMELGSRLGQGSEFSLLVAYSALAAGLIDSRASYLIQMVVILSFVLSTYWVVYRYRTPISSTAQNRMD